MRTDAGEKSRNYPLGVNYTKLQIFQAMEPVKRSGNRILGDIFEKKKRFFRFPDLFSLKKVLNCVVYILSTGNRKWTKWAKVLKRDW